MLSAQHSRLDYDKQKRTITCQLKPIISISLQLQVNTCYTLGAVSLERIYDFQFMFIICLLVVYLTYFKKPVKETTFSSKIHKAFCANIRNDCVFSVIEK